MKKEELKPCPFCGCPSIDYFEGTGTISSGSGSEPTLCCCGCGIGFMTGYYGHGVSLAEVKKDVISKWNSRAKVNSN